MADAENLVLQIAAVGANPDAVLVLQFQEQVVRRNRRRTEGRHRVGGGTREILEGQILDGKN